MHEHKFMQFMLRYQLFHTFSVFQIIIVKTMRSGNHHHHDVFIPPDCKLLYTVSVRLSDMFTNNLI